MKIVTVVGARPQFIKAAVISRVIEGYEDVQEIIIHTGQHYDSNMSDVFFNQMHIPLPKYNLNVGSGNHGYTTGRMLEELEIKYLKLKPDVVLVYGDTNSTLAGTIAASKLNIPVVHVEAGLRSFNLKMAEEQNRIVADHLSKLRACPTKTAVENLGKEGIFDGVFLSGDVMYDAALHYNNYLIDPTFNLPSDFYLLTIHRAENTDNYNNLKNIVYALNDYEGYTGILPLHPRTKKMLKKYNLVFNNKKVKIVEPVGYLEMLKLINTAKFVITDSGGLQKEAYFFKKMCITLRNETEWVETVGDGWNKLVGSDYNKISTSINNISISDDYKYFYGHGNAGKIILDKIMNDII